MAERGRGGQVGGHLFQLGGAGLFVQVYLGPGGRFAAPAPAEPLAGPAARLAVAVADGRDRGHSRHGRRRSGTKPANDGYGLRDAGLCLRHPGYRHRHLPDRMRRQGPAGAVVFELYRRLPHRHGGRRGRSAVPGRPVRQRARALPVFGLATHLSDHGPDHGGGRADHPLDSRAPAGRSRAELPLQRGHLCAVFRAVRALGDGPDRRVPLFPVMG